MITPEQATREVETPSGEHKVVLREYLTGQDRRENRRLAMKLSKEKDDSNPVSVLEQAEDALVRKVVVSIDGKSQPEIDPAVEILGWVAGDYDFIMDEVNAVSDRLPEKKETTSDGSTPITSEGSA